MATFEPAFENTMKFEDDPLHPGRVTMEPSGCRARFGINENAHPEMPADFWTAPADLARDQAEKIFLADYWNVLHLDQVHSQIIANKIFDMAVNMGSRQATLYVQRTLNFLSDIAATDASRIAVDGVMGPLTLKALNAADPEALTRELRNFSRAHYEHLAAANPRFAGWLEGSLKRAQA